MVARWRNPTNTDLTITNADGTTQVLKPRAIIVGDYYKDQRLQYLDNKGIGVDLSESPVSDVISRDTRRVGDTVVSDNNVQFTIKSTADPGPTDNQFDPGIFWLNTTTSSLFFLQSVVDDAATWETITNVGGGGGTTLTAAQIAKIDSLPTDPGTAISTLQSDLTTLDGEITTDVTTLEGDVTTLQDAYRRPLSDNLLDQTMLWDNITPGDPATAFGSGWAVTGAAAIQSGTVSVTNAGALAGGFVPANGLENWLGNTTYFNVLDLDLTIDGSSSIYFPLKNSLGTMYPSLISNTSPHWYQLCIWVYVDSLDAGITQCLLLDFIRNVSGTTTAFSDLSTLTLDQWHPIRMTDTGIQNQGRLRFIGTGSARILLALPYLSYGNAETMVYRP